MSQHSSRQSFGFSLLLPLLLGFAAFAIIIGPWALDPQSVSWLMHRDPMQHYLGWDLCFYGEDWYYYWLSILGKKCALIGIKCILGIAKLESEVVTVANCGAAGKKSPHALPKGWGFFVLGQGW